jgi:hypothetical protein
VCLFVVQREVREEAGIELLDMEQRGLMLFEFVTGQPLMEVGAVFRAAWIALSVHDTAAIMVSFAQVHVFRATKFAGEPAETEEMRPQWFDIADIPFAQYVPPAALRALRCRHTPSPRCLLAPQHVEGRRAVVSAHPARQALHGVVSLQVGVGVIARCDSSAPTRVVWRCVRVAAGVLRTF